MMKIATPKAYVEVMGLLPLRSPKSLSIVYCALVTTEPCVTITCPFLYSTFSTAAAACSRFARVDSSSKTLFSIIVREIISSAASISLSLTERVEISSTQSCIPSFLSITPSFMTDFNILLSVRSCANCDGDAEIMAFAVSSEIFTVAVFLS